MPRRWWKILLRRWLIELSWAGPYARILRIARNCVLVLYLAALGYLYTQQQRLEYHPKANPDEPASVGLSDVKRLNIDTRDDQHLVAWYKKPQPLHPTILYFHGNTGNLADLKARIILLTDRGDGLLAVDYRGFGASSGTPNEAGLILDGEAAYEALLAREIGLKHIVIYGHSLGTGVAVALAARHRVAALVLEAPFTSAKFPRRGSQPMDARARLHAP